MREVNRGAIKAKSEHSKILMLVLGYYCSDNIRTQTMSEAWSLRCETSLSLGHLYYGNSQYSRVGRCALHLHKTSALQLTRSRRCAPV